ncbi:MAG: SPOR domain-containing protein, partial [Arenibacterium sp.]
GVLASLALVAGVGVWSYQLMMRDVSGVPVVRALEGPMRIQPEEPGGRPADHQGLAVNNVAAVGTAEGPADRLMLAPKPVELTEEDKPMAQLTEVANEVDEPPVTEDVVSAEVDALVAQLVAEATPIESTTALATEADTVVASVTPAVLTGPGLPSSLRPQLRPTRLDATPVSQPTPGTLREVDPADLPVGTRLAQLGAFETPELAREAWDRLTVQFTDYLGDKSRIVQEASSGGRTFYRLRAMGFDDIADARRFCAVLIAERADCIPVTVR